MNKYRPVIGLEIHVELKTKSKMFCQCDADYFGKKPNSNTCPVCLGLPGALPVPNKKAVEWALLIGRALNCQVNKTAKFDRKHYFYPDLPKGYQISQYDQPFSINGHLTVNNRKFGITRVHLEEDTGKLIHAGKETLVDFNRSGVPLVEIVTEPDFDNADDVKKLLEELRIIIRYLDVSDADMEKGSMRLEPNISVRKDPNTQLPKYKVEVKNINSFKFVKLAIEHEVTRQIELLDKGETPKQETRGFAEKTGSTYSQRTKEEAQDYRYFPEPDIPPMEFSDSYLREIFKDIPELPEQKLIRYVRDYKLRYQDAFVLTRDFKIAEYFEKVNSKLKIKNQNYEQTIVNLIINKKLPTTLPVDEFVKNALEIINPPETNRRSLEDLIDRLIKSNKKAVDDYKKGKENAIMFLVGQVMREMKGKANANLVKSMIKNQISKQL